MRWKCNKCGTDMHDQQNMFFVYDYDRGEALKYAKKSENPFYSRGYKSKKASGEIWRCPNCDNIQFDKKDWRYKKQIFDFKRYEDIFKRS